MAMVAITPRSIGGFYYHPRLVAVVHLVTIAWISGSILGSLYVVAPLAFHMALPARRADYVAFTSFSLGTLGMVAHFAIDRLLGMAGSAVLVLAAFVFVGGRVLRGLPGARVPGHVRLPVALALINVVGAAVAGLVLGVNKAAPFLPVAHLQAVIGHAHLATLGWAVMMVMGAAYRLLPMVLPAAMPHGPWPYVATGLTQLGAWGLFAGFAAAAAWTVVFAVVAALGVAVFLAQVFWMARHRRPPPTERPKPDWSVGHVLQALLYLALAVVLGVVLALVPASDASLRAAMAYGVFALVGFLSQMVVGVAGRMLPLYGWLWGFADRGHQASPPSLHRTPPRRMGAVVLLLWTVGVPALAAGLAFDRPGLTSASAASLLGAVVLGGTVLVVTLSRLWRLPPGIP